MSERKKCLYRFLVEMGRITADDYLQITGEKYAQA